MDRQKNRAERPPSSEEKKKKKKKIKKKDTGEQHGGDQGGQGQGSSSQKHKSASETQEREKHDLPPMYLDIDDIIITRTSDGEDSDDMCSMKSDSPEDAKPPKKIPPVGRRS